MYAMNHQGELEKKKYRNWVRGGLAYKYLKEGIEGFADEVVHQEHTRILNAVSHTPGLTCNQCCLRNLRPLHTCKKDHAGRNKCPWDQLNCNCLYPKKQACPDNVCDTIMEDILKCHGSTPPTPNWKNTDIQKWCTDPWEIAKCFINAPGYSNKTKAADIDTPGLLHVFINNIHLQSHFSDSINWNDTLKKILQRRNELFHSSTMEMEDTKLDECIDEIIAVLKDEKELKARNDAQQAVYKLKQLKRETFIITTHIEAEVCRDALASITKKSEEMKQTIQDAKYDIVKKQKEVTDAIEVKRKKAADAIQGAKGDIETKQTEAVKAIRDANDYFGMKAKEATDKIQDMKADIDEKQKEATEAITDITQKALQDALQEMEKHSVLERVERLELDSSVSKQRLTLLESEIDKLEKIRHNRLKQLDYAEGKQVLQKGLVTIYQNHYVKTSISPLKLKENNLNITEVYVAPKMVAKDNMDKSESQTKEKSQKKPSTRTIQQYREILQTNGRKHKNIYIVGGVGTGKSTFCKMMIQNWCSAVTDGSPIPANDNDKCKEPRRTVGSEKYDPFSAVNDGNINEMRKFEFLFFVPLQRMSGLGDITEMIKAIVKAFGLTTDDFIDRIFEQESERCLIVADGLDEWTYPKAASVLQHVSCGLPNRDEARRATLITLSRPSAKGILNMKSSEYDQKMELVGIISVQHFIEKYLSKFNNTDLSYCILMMKLKMTNHEHLEKTPLLLQQLVWLYGSGNRIGKSVSDTYSHLVNIMLGWSQNKEEGEKEDQTGVTNEWRDIQLPGLLQKFPRFEANKRFLVQLARVAFEALTSEMGSITFSPSHLRKSGVSKEGISTLIKLGILTEKNCIDPTLENTQMEFIHISYLEFFAAVYVSSYTNANQRPVLLNTVLHELFTKCHSVADILQLSNMLKMICGLSPFLISELSKLISNIVSRDESMVTYRNSLQENIETRKDNVSDQIQRLIFSCLSMCDADDPPMVSLCDVIMDRCPDMSFLQRIIPGNVLSLYASGISNAEVFSWIARLKCLQYMRIDYCRLPHSEMVLVTSMIGEAPLKHLILYCTVCSCSNCHGHTIDLSKNEQLQKFELIKCTRVKISNVNTKHLEVLSLDSYSLPYIDFLVNASSLTKLCFKFLFLDDFKYNKQLNSVVHILQKLRKFKLECVDVADSALIVTPRMKNLEHIELWRVTMSLQTWRRFVDSLLTLQQSVQVDTAGCFICEEVNGEGLNYVRKNTILFQVIEDDWISFSFRTNK